MQILAWITGLAFSYLMMSWAGRIRSEKKMLDIKYDEERMQYVVSVKEEMKLSFSVSYKLFYEAYLFVYTNQNMIPNDKELLKYREMFTGYFKMKITKEQLERYLEVFNYDMDKLNSQIDYMFMNECQKMFINPALEAIADAGTRKKR